MECRLPWSSSLCPFLRAEVLFDFTDVLNIDKTRELFSWICDTSNVFDVHWSCFRCQIQNLWHKKGCCGDKGMSYLMHHDVYTMCCLGSFTKVSSALVTCSWRIPRENWQVEMLALSVLEKCEQCFKLPAFWLLSNSTELSFHFSNCTETTESWRPVDHIEPEGTPSSLRLNITQRWRLNTGIIGRWNIKLGV